MSMWMEPVVRRYVAKVLSRVCFSEDAKLKKNRASFLTHMKNVSLCNDQG